jgi:hypothetical protein
MRAWHRRGAIRCNRGRGPRPAEAFPFLCGAQISAAGIPSLAASEAEAGREATSA